jgi:hypothetical protein
MLLHWEWPIHKHQAKPGKFMTPIDRKLAVRICRIPLAFETTSYSRQNQLYHLEVVLPINENGALRL